MAVQEIIMIRTLIRAMRNAHRAVIRANRAEEPDQRNTQLSKLGCSLIIMGVISIATTIKVLTRPPERIFAYPTYMHMHVILSLVLGFIALFGLVGITVGMFLLAMNNPGKYHCLAMVILWASSVAAAFAIGILLVASFSLSSIAPVYI